MRFLAARALAHARTLIAGTTGCQFSAFGYVLRVRRLIVVGLLLA
jgi:hypothetical protein